MAVVPEPVEAGLMDRLLTAFRASGGPAVETVTADVDRALELGERGEVDLVLVNDRERETVFVHRRLGINRRTVFADYFVLAGPPGDPAGLAGLRPASGKPADGTCIVCGKGGSSGALVAEAFRRLAAARQPFLSRGPGTVIGEREARIWEAAGVDQRRDWHRISGAGMRETLLEADRRLSYVLTDEAAYRLLEGKLRLRLVHSEEIELLYNPFSVIAVNPARVPGVNHREAMLFLEWLAGAEGQAAVASFADAGGHPYYIPVAAPRPAQRPDPGEGSRPGR